MAEAQKTATLEEKNVNINGRGGKQERCGYICASVARGPDSVLPSFYVVAVLSLAFLDSHCFDTGNANIDGTKWSLVWYFIKRFGSQHYRVITDI